MQATVTSGMKREESMVGQTDHRTARLLARSMFKDFKSNGIPNDRIIEFASELIGLVTDQLREDQPTEQG